MGENRSQMRQDKPIIIPNDLNRQPTHVTRWRAIEYILNYLSSATGDFLSLWLGKIEILRPRNSPLNSSLPLNNLLN